MSLIGKKVNIILFIVMLNCFYNFSSLANLLANPDLSEDDSPTLEDVAGILDGKDFNAKEKKVTIAGFKETSDSMVKWNINVINTVKDVLLLYNHSALNSINHTEIKNSFWNDVKGVASLALDEGLNKASSKLFYSAIPLGNNIADSYLFILSSLSLLPEAMKLAPISAHIKYFSDVIDAMKNENVVPLAIVGMNYQWLMEGQKIIEGYKSQDYETRTKAKWESLKYLYMLGLTFSPFIKFRGVPRPIINLAKLKEPILIDELPVGKKIMGGTEINAYLIKQNNQQAVLKIEYQFDQFRQNDFNLNKLPPDVIKRYEKGIKSRYEYAQLINQDTQIAPKVLGLIKNKEGVIIGYLEEYVKGTPLSELIAKQKINSTQLNEVISDIQSQLELLHKKGYVHSDLNIVNILVDTSGEMIKARMIDFSKGRKNMNPAQQIEYDNLLFEKAVAEAARSELQKREQFIRIDGPNKTVRNMNRFLKYQKEMAQLQIKSIDSYISTIAFLEKTRYKLWIKDQNWIAHQIREGKIDAKSLPQREMTQQDLTRMLAGDEEIIKKYNEPLPINKENMHLYVPKSFEEIYQERMNYHKTRVQYYERMRKELRDIYNQSLEK